MMSVIFVVMIVCSFVFAVLTGRVDALSTAALTEAQRAVELVISLLGIYCLWGGIMQVAEDSSVTKKLSKFMSPVTKKLFKGIKSDGEAMGAISMNIVANLLGLGNAATPLGIDAMEKLQKEERPNGIATNNMALFVVMNTASLQLIPTTTAMLRSAAGSETPLDILPAVWLASLVSVLIGIAVAKGLEKLWK